jgi:hypothetical protein
LELADTWQRHPRHFFIRELPTEPLGAALGPMDNGGDSFFDGLPTVLVCGTFVLINDDQIYAWPMLTWFFVVVDNVAVFIFFVDVQVTPKVLFLRVRIQFPSGDCKPTLGITVDANQEGVPFHSIGIDKD